MGSRCMFCTVCGEVSLGMAYCSPKCKQKAYRKRKKQQQNATARTIDMTTYTMQEKMIATFGNVTESKFIAFFDTFGKAAYVEMIAISFDMYNEFVGELLNGRS